MNKVYIGIGAVLLLLVLAVGGTVLAGGVLFFYPQSPIPAPEPVGPVETTEHSAPPTTVGGVEGGKTTPGPGGAVGSIDEDDEDLEPDLDGAAAEEGEEATAPSSGTSGGGGSSCADTIQGVTKHSATHYTLSRDFFNRYVRDQGNAMSQGGASWRQNKKKKTVGLRIFSLKCAPKVAGLKNNDVIRTIDGRSLDSSTAALLAYNGVLNSSRVTVGLRRNGESLTIRYDIE